MGWAPGRRAGGEHRIGALEDVRAAGPDPPGGGQGGEPVAAQVSRSQVRDIELQVWRPLRAPAVGATVLRHQLPAARVPRAELVTDLEGEVAVAPVAATR